MSLRKEVKMVRNNINGTGRQKKIRKLRKKVRKEVFSLTDFPQNIKNPLDLTGG